MPEMTYSTGEAAYLLNVHVKTVLKWCKQGKLLAHRTSSPIGHFRITRTALVEYARQNGIPLPAQSGNE